jgi:hypothetical protein
MNRLEFLDTAKDCITRDRAATHGNVKIEKVKKPKNKRCDAGIPNGPEEKHNTCQRYVIDEGRMFVGKLCNEPLRPMQKKYCTKHKTYKKPKSGTAE